MSFGLVALILFASAFVVTAALAGRWLWVAALGAAGGLVWWAWTLLGGCDRASEVRCGWQPVLSWVFMLFFLAAWLGGVGIGLLLRRQLIGSEE
jgi:hypothetical protein